MGGYVLGFDEIDQTQVARVGGKGAHLGELSRIEGIRVPAGFCVTTDAFLRMRAQTPSIDERLDRLSRVKADDREAIRTLSVEIRQAIEGIAVPDDVAVEVTGAVTRLGEKGAYAVRSSATAEDMPSTSFAGQHDTYVNVVGPAAILLHVSRCWASLFTERAVTYRVRNGFDHSRVHMAVVVQRMVAPLASGVMFTADPVTGNRKVSSVEAVRGLGEALVSGLVNPDVFKVRGGEILERTGQHEPAPTDAQIVRLVELGRRIEAHFGRPQDIEWCLADGDFYVVQSRPITTLFPIPQAGDRENHVYLSVGHQQMMTDPIKPLGISMWQLTAARPMFEAGGRLFVDVTQAMGAPESAAALLEMAGKSDPLTRDALQTILERGDFIPLGSDGAGGRVEVDAPPPGLPASGEVARDVPSPPGLPASGEVAWVPASGEVARVEVVMELMARTQASIATLKRDIRTRSGPPLLDFILADIRELRRILFDPQSHQVFMGAMEATWWLNDQLQLWLGEKNAADTLAQSVPHNVTSEMGLALMDVADVIRPHPEVLTFLEHVDDEGFLDDMAELAGGPAARDAIVGFLDMYGMRCAGEIDITRPRWSERPTTLVPVILGNVKNFGPGAGRQRFEQGLEEAKAKEREVLERLRSLPNGEEKAAEAKRMIDRVRTFIGYREYPKYGMVSRYFVYKQALLREAQHLVQTHVLREQEDIFYLSFQELDEVVRTSHVDDELLRRRKDAFRSYEALTPPRVLTSDGEAITGAYRRDDVPDGALVGLPVSAGTVEGQARVVLDMAEANLEVGDILVTAYTDPSWTPLFVAIKGLVTEVGGLMTHGAVIAREYGLPAVVGVVDATRLIRDGQRIRVHGTEGYVEILP